VKVADTIWTGHTGRELRRHPPEVRELMFYLVTCPEKDLYGLYACEIELAASRMGRTAGKVESALKVLVDLGFCRFDDPTQWVWIIEMAHHQFDLPLKAVDYRCQGAKKWYRTLPRNPFMGEWFDRYALDFHLGKEPNPVDRRDWIPRGATPAPPGPVEGPNSTNSGFELVSTGVIGGSGGEEGNPDRPLTGRALDAAFEEVWEAYPNSKEKKEARLEFGKLKPSRRDVDRYLGAIAQQKLGRSWNDEGGKYIPRLVNWLKKGRWDDKVDLVQQTVIGEKTSTSIAAAQGFLANRRRHES